MRIDDHKMAKGKVKKLIVVVMNMFRLKEKQLMHSVIPAKFAEGGCEPGSRAGSILINFAGFRISSGMTALMRCETEYIYDSRCIMTFGFFSRQ